MKSLKQYLTESKSIKQQVIDMLGFEPMFIDKQTYGYRVSLGTYKTDVEKDRIIKSFSKIIKDNSLEIRTNRFDMHSANGSKHVDVIIPFDRIEK